MKKIVYKTLEIQDFLSIGKESVIINYQEGINQIEGRNIDEPDRKNACGKSVLCNGHFFALFGETLDKIKGEFIVNNITNGKGMVKLDFSVETLEGIKNYLIERQVKPSKVKLICDGVDITLDSIANTNKYINNLLQTNTTIHKCCDIMTIRDTVPFMSMDASDKRKFIEEIFSIGIFGTMLKDLKKRITDTKNLSNISSAKLSEITNSYNTLIQQRDEMVVQIREREAILQKRRSDMDRKIEDIKTKISSIIIGDVEQIKKDQIKFNDAWTKLDGLIAEYYSKIVELNSKKKSGDVDIKKRMEIGGVSECPRCLQDIPHTHKELINEELAIMVKEVEEHTKKIEKLEYKKLETTNKKTKVQSKLKELGDEFNQIKLAQQQLESLNLTLKQYQYSRKELDEDIDNSANSLDLVEDNITKIDTRRNDEAIVLENYKQLSSDLDICKFILGEEGVKSFVVKKLLDLLNNTIERYLVSLGLGVRCKFDEYFDEIITNGRGKVFSYKNASGAEKKSLDFACSLSFSDMRKKINGVYSNVEWIDEFLDSAVDTVGLIKMLDVLKDRADENNSGVYIISHRKEVIPHITGETILLEKRGGITRKITS